MMMRISFVALLLGLSGATHAQQTLPQIGLSAEGVNPETIGEVAIWLGDFAQDGCWTNLREVREYAEEKLVQGGYTYVTDHAHEGFSLSITVSASRESSFLGAGRCHGLVQISLGLGLRYPNGLSGNLISADATTYFSGERDLNDMVIWYVGEFLNEL